MHSRPQFLSLISGTISRAARLALAIVFVVALILIFTQPAQAQTYKVLYNFTGGADGAFPFAGLTMDRAGNLYGTAAAGGQGNSGTVFRFSRRGNGWALTPLYSFQGGNDGNYPWARVIFGPDGNLYGTTFQGGGTGCGGYGCGTVFKLSVPPTALGTWTETVVHRFSEDGNGTSPTSEVVFDETSILYGTTSGGGASGCGWPGPGCGVVYSLTPSSGGWTENVLWRFTGSGDGGVPWAGVTFDTAGNLYGTSIFGGAYGGGIVFQLSHSGSDWTENVLHDFQWNDGTAPFGGLTFDRVGNVYGTTARGGSQRGGTVFMLSPSDGAWTFSLLYSLTGTDPNNELSGSWASLTVDTAGNLYGTTVYDGAYGYGNVFKLTHSDGGWAYSSLHDFCSDAPVCSDGLIPRGSLVIDGVGNLYGTASGYGTAGVGVGVIFEITP